jgi:hypothetical protein
LTLHGELQIPELQRTRTTLSQKFSIAEKREELSASTQESCSFSGHETFVFRYGWLTKACRAVSNDPGIFGAESASVQLGVGKNMVRSMRHWALATGVLMQEPGSRGIRLLVCPFGKLLLGEGGLDPYLEDPGTLWLLHWRLVRNRSRCTTWRWAFQKLPSNDFTHDSLGDLIRNEVRGWQAKPVSDGVVRRDVEVFIRTYVPARAPKNCVLEDSLDCPLVELQLIDDAGSGHFRFRRGEKPSLSVEVFLFCLSEFWKETAPNQQTLALSEIAFGDGSPGSILKLDELTIISRLELLQDLTEGAMYYEESAGIRQVYRTIELDPIEYLKRYYLS